jgi:glycosyltransferase involved in cell wall biosynthesis
MPSALSSVSFFCPAYNEEKNLPKLIPKVHAFLREITSTFEIIIVEDGSPDRTVEVVEELSRRFPEVRIVRHEQNQGYGVTVRDGFTSARYDYVMYTDADNQYDILELKDALPLLANADIVSGYVRSKAVSFRRKIQSFVFNTLILVLFGVWIRDINCSMKIYKRAALDAISIKSTSAFIDAEMLIQAKRAGCTIAQFPVTHFHRIEGVAHGSKLNVVIPTIVDMFKFRLGIL